MSEKATQELVFINHHLLSYHNVHYIFYIDTAKTFKLGHKYDELIKGKSRLDESDLTLMDAGMKNELIENKILVPANQLKVQKDSPLIQVLKYPILL